MKKKAIICDIDGTIANIDHRIKHWEKKPRDYPKFYETIEDDKPISEIIWIVQKLSEHAEIIYLTGRHEGTRNRTKKWLNDHHLPECKLLMRGDTDFRPDVEIKKIAYYGLIYPKFDILFVLDDRQRVVKMWRDIGLRCLAVAEGNY